MKSPRKPARGKVCRQCVRLGGFEKHEHAEKMLMSAALAWYERGTLKEFRRLEQAAELYSPKGAAHGKAR